MLKRKEHAVIIAINRTLINLKMYLNTLYIALNTKFIFEHEYYYLNIKKDKKALFSQIR